MIFPPVFAKHQKGLTLIEVALATAIMGVSAMGFWQYAGGQIQRKAEAQSIAMLASAQNALVAYAFIHGRLPCPAKDKSGFEVCDGNSSGTFPYITAGLPQMGGGSLQYRLGIDGTLVTTPKPLRVLLPSITSTGVTAITVERSAAALNSDGKLIELCQALSSAKTLQDVAFQLLPQTGVPFAYQLSPGRTLTNSQLLDRLQCQVHLVAAAKSHFNARLSSETLLRALQDYQQEKAFLTKLAGVDIVTSTWGVANGAMILIRAAVKSNVQAAALLDPNPFATALAVDKTAKLAVLTANAGLFLVRQSANLARSIANLALHLMLVDEINGALAEVETLSRTTIPGHTGLNASSGMQFDLQAKPQP